MQRYAALIMYIDVYLRLQVDKACIAVYVSAVSSDENMFFIIFHS